MAQYVYGKNVVKQLLNDDKKIYEVLIQEGMKDRSFEDLLKQKKIPVRVLNKKKLEALLKTDHHQGIAASIDEYKTYSVDEILKAVPAGKTPLLVMLDGLEDPHNLGAILRTCDCVGADGVIIGKHRSVQLTPRLLRDLPVLSIR